MSAPTDLTARPSLPVAALPPVGQAFALIGIDRGTVVLRGEIDLALAGILARLAETVPKLSPRVVVDAAEVTFADSTLVDFLAELGTYGPVSVHNSPRAVRELFHLVDLSPEVTLT
jgi:anti-anti-sigma regulatory factor